MPNGARVNYCRLRVLGKSHWQCERQGVNIRALFLGFHNLNFHSSPTLRTIDRMSQRTLEALPPEMLVEILQSFDSFTDLHALATASAVFYRLIDAYGDSILTQLAKNIIGLDAWEAAITVLLYQRKDNNEATGSRQDHAVRNFVLQREDILNLVANQQFFKNVSQSFAIFDSADWPRENCYWAETSFTVGDVLSVEFFYKSWLYSIQFACDTIETFYRRPRVSEQHLSDLCLLSKVVLLLDGPQHHHRSFKSVWSSGGYESTWFANVMVFEPFDWNGMTATDRTKDTLLFQKMTNHLSAAYEDDSEYEGAWSTFFNDYGGGTMAIEAIMKKYRFDRCWDEKLVLVDVAELNAGD